MAILEGGSTIAGYPIFHAGMPEMYLNGSLNFTGNKRIKFGPNPSYGGTLYVGGDSPIRASNIANLWTSDGNVHVDTGTSHGFYINWNSGTPTSSSVFVVGNGAQNSVLRVDQIGNLYMDTGTISLPNNKNVGVQNFGATHWVRPQDANGNMHLLANTGAIYLGAPAIKMEAPNGGGAYLTVNESGVSMEAANGWFRANGNNGFYFQSWGGGWYMQDATWVRLYNGKSLYTGSGAIATEARVSIGTSTDTGAKLFVTWPGGNVVSRPGGNWSAMIENTVDSTSYNGLSVATRWGTNATIVFEAASYWNGGAQGYTPALTVYGDRSVRIPKAIVIPVGTDMYAT